MRSPSRLLFLALAAAPVLLVSAPAMATSPCANVCYFTAPASSCTLEVEGGCQAQCTPLSVTGQCDAMCNGSIEASCTASCEGDCMTKCTVDPGTFQCQGSCESECTASCQGSCMTNDQGDSQCEGACMADCQNRCDLSCNVTPPSANCQAQCQASCQGNCQVQANVKCQAGCTVTATGGCTAACQEPSAAIFCDGQYLSAKEVNACLQCLETNGFSLQASGTVTCTPGNCGAVGSASVCSAAPALGSSKDGWGVFGITSLVVGLGLLASRRRKTA